MTRARRPSVTSGDWRDIAPGGSLDVLASGWLRVRINETNGRCTWDRLEDAHAFRFAAGPNVRAPMHDYDELLVFVSQFGLGLESMERQA